MKVICVTDRRLCRGDFLERIDGIARAGVDAVLLREKDLGESAYEALAGACLEICARHGTELILHTHAAVARRLGKLALHLPAAALFQDRETFRSFARVGVSVHSVEEALRARAWGADRLIAGHVFPTDCKPGLPPRGTEFLEAVCRAVAVPVFAIGGIAAERMPAIQRTAVAGVCVMSGFMTGEPERLLRQLTSREAAPSAQRTAPACRRRAAQAEDGDERWN